MIPKIIHFCWFGGKPFSDLTQICIDSWKEMLPDYEIILWNESNFDVNMYQFSKEAYEQGKYAYVSDVCRLYVLKEYGGIYLDSDVEIIKNIDHFLIEEAFSGFEDNDLIPTGIMGSVKDGDWITELLNYYKDKSFYDENGNVKMIPNTVVITEIMKKKGVKLNNKLQCFDKYVSFYPSEYFCPKSHLTGEIKITPNTYCIHHFAGSWLTPAQKERKEKEKNVLIEYGKLIHFIYVKVRSLKERIKGYN